MLHIINSLNILLFFLFFFCYAYQLVYVVVRIFKKLTVPAAKQMHKYAVLIAARNESRVIGELINSIRSQKYPADLLDIYVVADNCTDDTAQLAYRSGATVFERSNTQKVGKGYALNHMFAQIDKRHGIEYYEGYFVFDADNILDENFVKEMNKVYDKGYRVVTSYRNSKNFGYNWISAGYGLWFIRESKFLNGARMLCNTSCAISGTGFLVSSAIIKNDNGWKYNLLTEDIEFSTDKITSGEVIGYSENAVLYDEQPVDFKTSWNQRLRWSKGFYQVMRNYGFKLLKGCFKGKKFQCFDMLMTIAPATLLTLSMLLANSLFFALGLILERPIITAAALTQIGMGIINIYCSLFFFGVITLITEWKRIYCSAVKKIWYVLTFPVFMFTYVPIAIVALYKKITWEPIQHTFVVKSTEYRR